MAEKNKKQEEVTYLANAGNAAVMQQSMDDEEVIDLWKLAEVLLEHIHYIILCFLVGAIILNAYAYFMIQPAYQSTGKMYMVSASQDSVVNFTDLNIGQALTSDYEELIFSYPVFDEVIEKMNLDITSKQLAGMISINNPENTRVLVITATTGDPEMSYELVNTLMDVIREYLPRIMSTDKPNVAQRGKVEPNKVAPSYFKYTLIGAILGAGIYCMILIITFLRDDTIKSQEDLENYFGITPLTVIPESEVFAEEENKVTKRKLFGGRN